MRVSSLLDIDYKKIPFVRGGGDDGFQTPTKKINVAMEDHLLRTCQSESTGRYGGSIQDSLLKTCSSHRSGLMSVKKTIGKSKSKSVAHPQRLPLSAILLRWLQLLEMARKSIGHAASAIGELL